MLKLNMMAVLALVSNMAVAGMNNNDIYVGAGVGMSILDPEYVDGSAGPGDEDFAWQAFAGYDINDYLSIEASYANLGDFEFENKQSSYQIYSLQGLLYYPSNSDNWSVYAKLGASFTDVDNSDALLVQIGNKYGVSGGLGVRWNLDKNWMARAEYNVYNEDLHAVFFNLGYAWRGDSAVIPITPITPEVQPTIISINDSEHFDSIFDFDSAIINNPERLEPLIELLVNSKGQIIVKAHTDNIGTEQYNQRLSEQRAQSAINYFISNGIASNRFVGQGMGELHPVASNQTKEGRAKNRRLDVEYITTQQE